MESIDKLRDYSHLDDDKWTLETGEIIYMYGTTPNDPNAINWGEQWRKIAEEIEQEIAERYILGPLDAGGVPIRIGDTLEGAPGSKWDGERFEVGSMEVTACGWEVCDVETCDSIAAGQTRHVKHLTIEDAISDAIRDYATTDMSREEIAAKYAEEIRGMMA